MGQIPPIRGNCPAGTKGVGTGGAKRRMRRRVVRSEMSLRLRNPKASLGDQGKLSAKLTEGIRTLQVAERHPMAQQNGRLLIPSGFVPLTHRLAAARSRRGSDSPPGCHSTPRRRFATLVTKGRLENAETWQQPRNKNPSPHQSPSVTAIPTPFAPSGHFPLIGGIDPPRGKPLAFLQTTRMGATA